MTDKLELLLADGVIDEVLGRLKSGKEADISLVRRGPAVIAAKVYKDRATRSFKNNADYKEGRKVRNSRTQRAMDSGGRFGRDAAEQAWKSAEADALYKLAGTGVRVPAPVMFYEGVLLMDLVRDAEGRPAPRLIDVGIEREAARGILGDLIGQIIAMLCCDLIHGDLSPYNILAAAEGPTIIDFPQVVSAVHSSRAEFFFMRDFENVVRFLAGFDPALAPRVADGRAIWRAYVSRELTPGFVPPPPPPPRPTRGPDRRSHGRPPQNRDARPPQGRDRDARPAQGQNRDARPPQGQGRDARPPQGQGRDARPPQAQGRDARPPQGQGRDARPPQAQGRDARPPQAQGRDARPGQPAQPQPPRPPAGLRRPPPPVTTRWSADGPSSVGPSQSGRRRPKRRW